MADEKTSSEKLNHWLIDTLMELTILIRTIVQILQPDGGSS